MRHRRRDHTFVGVNDHHTRPRPKRLTARQMEVLALMAEGHSNSSISQQLFISEKAVVQHTSQIYARFELEQNEDEHRRVKAVLRYLGA